MPAIEQGDVFDYDFGPQQDNRQEGRRPAVVVQTNMLNKVQGYGLTILVPLSQTGKPSPSHVRIEPSQENGLTDVSFAKCEQIYTLSGAGLQSKRGALSKADLIAIKQALRLVLEL